MAEPRSISRLRILKFTDTHLFKLEDVTHEELLQVLIGVVDAELLKTVLAEVLKAEDVEQTDRLAVVHRVRLGLKNGRVDLVDDPDEHAPVHALHERVAHVDRHVSAHCCGDALAAREDGARGECVVQL